MTNEIAFEIGKGDFPRFYDSPTWRPNVEYFKYVKFFDWSHPMYGGKVALGVQEEIKWEWIFHGSLKESFFDLEHKRFYIKGVLASYAGKKNLDSLSFCFANSLPTRDRVAKWAEEILKDEFGGQKTWQIRKDEKHTVPIVASLVIEADEEVVDYLTSGNENN